MKGTPVAASVLSHVVSHMRNYFVPASAPFDNKWRQNIFPWEICLHRVFILSWESIDFFLLVCFAFRRLSLLWRIKGCSNVVAWYIFVKTRSHRERRTWHWIKRTGMGECWFMRENGKKFISIGGKKLAFCQIKEAGGRRLLTKGNFFYPGSYCSVTEWSSSWTATMRWLLKARKRAVFTWHPTE